MRSSSNVTAKQPIAERQEAGLAARLREMIGPFGWAVDGAAIAHGAIEVNGWMYVRDDVAASVTVAIDGEPFDEARIRPAIRRDVCEALWYAPAERRLAFRARKNLQGAAVQAPVLRVSARWPGADPAWCERHDFRVPGPAPRDSDVPLPDAEHIARVSGSVEPQRFRIMGCNAFHTLRAAAARHGVDFGSAGDVLDWGVGCGRTERFWEGDARLVGCDVDADNIGWCRANLRGRYETIAPDPPTCWPKASFDVIFGVSVISHLPDAARHAWYEELNRLARPGALVLLSLLGDAAVAKAGIDAATLSRIDACGSVFAATSEAIDRRLGGRGLYGTTYQSSAAAAAQASQWFELVEHVLAGMNNHQDLLVLRRRG